MWIAWTNGSLHHELHGHDGARARSTFLLVGVNPALDRFTDLARELRQEAEEQARRHGRELGAAVAIAA